MPTLKPPANRPEAVDEFMTQLDHPFKAEIETVRALIKSVHPDITEEIKWNAPSFGYRRDYIVTFNLRARDRLHLVFHNPHISKVDSEILEGSYPDRRMAYFTGRADVEAKAAALQKAVQDLLRLMDE